MSEDTKNIREESEDKGWAMEILHDYKVANKRMFMAFLISIFFTLSLVVAGVIVGFRAIDSFNKFTDVLKDFEFGIYSEAEQYGDGTKYNVVGPEGGVTFESESKDTNNQEPK